MAVWHYRRICIDTCLYQFYESQYCAFAKKIQGGRHKKGSGFPAPATDRAVLYGIHADLFSGPPVRTGPRWNYAAVFQFGGGQKNDDTLEQSPVLAALPGFHRHYRADRGQLSGALFIVLSTGESIEGQFS